MKKFNTVSAFLAEIGFQCKGRQGQYSYVDHDKKQVFFGIDTHNPNHDKGLILSSDWEYDDSRKTKSGRSYKQGNYTTSLNNIRLIQDSGYELIACKIKTEQTDGKVTKSKLFDIENLRSYSLNYDNGDYFAV
ncbi:hypothetical protein [Vibrio vulnificus]|uniref:hypothetical protein n=1 Tax=Vibrio vulnificus TaxID=672 RepID=UPI00102C2F59|nr:hypothetical protein [Vibrio vulnificus]RZR37134.1 hypothetical protein D8T58_24300 [Vibrio vulnificus]